MATSLILEDWCLCFVPFWVQADPSLSAYPSLSAEEERKGEIALQGAEFSKPLTILTVLGNHHHSAHSCQHRQPGLVGMC